MSQFDFFDQSGRGSGMQSSINASNSLFQGIEQRKMNAMQMLGIEDEQRRGAMNEDAKTAELLIRNGDNQGAMEFLSDRAQASSQSGGDPSHTREVFEDLRANNPQAALEKITNYRSIFDDTFEDPRENQGRVQEGTAQEKNIARLKALRAEDPALALDFERLLGLNDEVKMSSAVEKQVITAQDDYFKNTQTASKMQVLATDIGKIDFGGGTASTLSEKFKGILGSQDEVSNLRRDFNAIRTSQATQNLPPGPASDKDIELALSGFPPENAPASMVISFLNGQRKLAELNANYAKFKANWFAEKKKPGGLINAWQRQTEMSFNSELTPQSATSQGATSLSESDQLELDRLEAQFGGQ